MKWKERRRDRYVHWCIVFFGYVCGCICWLILGLFVIELHAYFFVILIIILHDLLTLISLCEQSLSYNAIKDGIYWVADRKN